MDDLLHHSQFERLFRASWQAGVAIALVLALQWPAKSTLALCDVVPGGVKTGVAVDDSLAGKPIQLAGLPAAFDARGARSPPR